MDDVDRIVLSSLKEIGFEIRDDIPNLKHYPFEQMVQMVISCLKSIQPDLKLPSSLPSLMSTRYNICAQIAQTCSELGFKGEIGYHTFLYANTIEIRKILIFLVEHLPRNVATFEETDESENSNVTIRQKTSEVLRELLNKSKPTVNQYKMCESPFISNVLETGTLLPNQKIDCKPLEWRDFVAKKLPFIDEQLLDNRFFLPSVISLNYLGLVNPLKSKCSKFNINQQSDCSALNVNSLSRIKFDNSLKDNEVLLSNSETELNISKIENDENTVESNLKNLEGNETATVELEQEISDITQHISTVSARIEEVTKRNDNLRKTVCEKNIQESSLQKSLLLLPDFENNIPKLQAANEKCEQKLLKLELQWKQHKELLLDQREDLKKINYSKTVEKNEFTQQILNIRNELFNTIEEIKKRDLVNQRLRGNVQLVVEDAQRNEYVQRILEIIKNLKKQDEQINNILTDMRYVQKEINNLSGKINRSFALAEQLITLNSVSEEFSRETRKLLLSLHKDVSDILTMITEIGNYSREIKDLDDQVNENSNNIEESLNQVINDLKNVKEEQAALEDEIQMLTSESANTSTEHIVPKI